MLIIDSPRVEPAAVAILPGSYNPPTRAHIEIARSVLAMTDVVLFTLPQKLPHKDFSGASLEQRLSMLRRITENNNRLGTALAEGGLYAEIAREAKEQFPHARIRLVCGRDAAERIVNWNYAEPGVVERMLSDFDLLVAPRNGPFTPPPHLRERIFGIDVPNLDACSSTLLRERLAAGGNWQELAPAEIADVLEAIYGK